MNPIYLKFLGQTMQSLQSLQSCTNFGGWDIPKRQPSKSDIEFSQQQPIRWLSTLVVPDAKLIFCPQYKVGTNEFLRLLRVLDGQDYNTMGSKHYIVGKNSLKIAYNLTLLREFRHDALQMMFDSDWAKLVIVRDPLDRLRSAYFDKIRRRHPDQKVFAKALNVPVPVLRSLTFADFVRRVDAQMKRNVTNVHWQKQAQACGLTHFKKCYQYVLHMGLDKSTHPVLRDCVLRIMGSRVSKSKLSTLQNIVVSDKIKSKLHKHQTDSNFKILDDIYDMATCKRALRIYAEDYDLFSLPRPACHETSPRVRWPV